MTLTAHATTYMSNSMGHFVSEGQSPDDREVAINFFRWPRECKIYQQTSAKISTSDIAVFSTVTFQNLYQFNINSLLFRQPNITSQPYIHSHSHCRYKAIPYKRRKTSRNRFVCLSPIDSNRSFPISSPLNCDVILGFGFRVPIFLGFLLAGIEEDFLVQIPRLHVTWRHSSGIKWKGRSAFWISFWTIGLSKSYRLQFNTQPNETCDEVIDGPIPYLRR